MPIETKPSFTNNLPRDASTSPIQVGGSFKTQDKQSNWVSPTSLSGGIDVFEVPDNAAEFIVFPSSNDMQISELSDMSSSDLVSKGSKEVYACAGMPFVYVQGISGDTLYFRFNMLGPLS